MKKIIAICCLSVSSQLAAEFPLLDKTRSEVFKAMQEVRSVVHVDCVSDVESYETPMIRLQNTQSKYSGNYYLAREPQGAAAIRMLGQGWALIRLESADKLLANNCSKEAKEFYRDVIRSSSDVSLQNRAMLGLEDIRDKKE